MSPSRAARIALALCLGGGATASALAQAPDPSRPDASRAAASPARPAQAGPDRRATPDADPAPSLAAPPAETTARPPRPAARDARRAPSRPDAGREPAARGRDPGRDHTSHDPAPPPAPADAVTHHVLSLPGRTLAFTATVGVLPLHEASGEAEVGTTAYTLDGADPATRPVTFLVNGGPGMASGWLQLGAAGPWRLPLTTPEGVFSPSLPAAVVPNAETWLDFTDLVFLDPPGTGFARAEGDARKAVWSVGGDVDALAEAMHRWLAQAGRLASPKALAGESYGGFRGPRLVRALARDGVGIGALVLVSPALDIGGVFGDGPLGFVDRLPSEAATARERAPRSDAPGRDAPPDRAGLADVERYAAGEYLIDLYAGVNDPAVLDRVSARVAALTGLDPALVRRLGGRVPARVFVREEARAQGRVASLYDATVTGPDPEPLALLPRFEDPVLDALIPPVASAMADVYARRLGWHGEQPYVLFDQAAARGWDWGRGISPPQSLDALRADLALDPLLRVVVLHGLEDLVCPYFGSVLLLRQLPFGPDRLRLITLGGGHMFYTRDAGRAGLRAEALRVIGGGH